MSLSTVKIISLSLFVLLAGCTANNGELDQTTISLDHELIDEYGLKLEPTGSMYITPEAISETYLDTMACMGMTATGPTVEFRSFSFAGLGGAWGIYHSVTKTIWINIDDNNVQERNARTDKETLQHEFVHHILSMNDAGEDSHAHASPFFAMCGKGVNTYN